MGLARLPAAGRIAALFALVLSGTGGPAVPADGAALEPGATLRISAKDRDSLTPRVRSCRATLLRASGESLWVVPARDGAVPLALGDVRVERLAGRNHLAGTFAGAALGLLAGLGAGAAAAIVEERRQRDDAGYSYITFPILGAAIGAPAGAVIGGVRGLDRWERVR